MAGQRIDYRVAQQGQAAALERIVSRVQSQLAVLPGGDRRPGDASVVFFGMGASFAACAVPVAILAAAGVRATREIASEMHAGLAVPANTLAIGVSQSGRSPETVEVLRRVPADRRCVLTNVAGAALSDVTGLSYDLGSEQDSYASTIGYTGTIVGLAMLAEHLLGATAQDAAAGWHGIGSTLSAVEKETAPLVAAVAQASAGVVAADVVASGPSRAASEAGALLLREVCRVPSAALVTRNYLHGEMEAAGDTLHVIIGDGRERRLARTLADAGHVTLLVTTADAAAATDTAMTDTYPIPAAGGALHLITLPRVSMPVRVVLETLVLQQLAGALADARDIEIEDFVFEHDDTKIGGMVQ